MFGLSAALTTPFRADGGVDLARLSLHTHDVLAKGCNSVTLFGTTGEGYGISLRERAAMLGALAGSGIAPGTLYAGVSAPALDDALDQARLALDVGVRGLLVAPPFYLKGVGDDGLYDWFSRLFERTGASLRGVILYHIPGQTAVPLSIELIGRLKQAFPDAIAGVKDSSGNWENTQSLLDAHGELAILIGDERLLAKGLRAGAQGSICGLANLAPGLLRKMIDKKEDNATVVRLVDMLMDYPVLPAVKALTAHLRNDPGFAAVRPPLSALEPALAARVAAKFDAILNGS